MIPYRRGSSLLELIASMVTGSILLAGMTASILMSQQSLTIMTSGQNVTNSERQALNQLRTDLREATRIDMSNSSVWSVVVPDRNNDGAAESIQYRLPLTSTSTLSRNAWSTETLYPPNSLVHTMLARSQPPASPASTTSAPPVIEGISSNFSYESTNTLTVPCPGTSNVNDMQIAILAAGGSAGSLSIQGTGWTPVLSASNPATNPTLLLSIWSRAVINASVPNDSSPIIFSSAANDRLSGCVIRVSGHNPTITPGSVIRGKGGTPSVSGVTTTVNNTLHFRVLAANTSNFTPNYTGLFKNNCLMLESGEKTGNAVTLGVGSQIIATPTPAFNLSFSLPNSTNFITTSFIIRPR